MALTALCVISLAQAGETNAKAVIIGADYLSKHYNQITDPFEMAITTYALFVTNKEQKIDALIRFKSFARKICEYFIVPFLFLPFFLLRRSAILASYITSLLNRRLVGLKLGEELTAQ